MLTQLALLMGAFNTDTDAKTQFMEQNGPEHAQRIAFTRDDAGELMINVSDKNGPKRDGATEMIQATMLVDGDGRKSFLLTMQANTDKLGDLTDDEQNKIGAFLVEYFSGEKKDVVLSAKSDPELVDVKTFYVVVTDNDVTKFKDVTDSVEDYVMKGAWAYGFNFGKVSKIDPMKLDANLDQDVGDPTLNGAAKSTVVGRDTKLARGNDGKLELAGMKIDAIAYLKNEGGTMKMIFLDRETLDEITDIDIDADYATFDHGGRTMVMVGREINVDTEDGESFVVTRRPAAEMFATAA